MLAIGAFYPSLVLVGKALVHSLWLLGDKLVDQRDELEELGCDLVYFHRYRIGQFLQIPIPQLSLHSVVNILIHYLELSSEIPLRTTLF